MQGLADRRPHFFIVLAAILIIMTLGFTGHVVREIVEPGHVHLFQKEEGGFPEQVEQWRGAVEIACKDCDLDTKWVDSILAMMQVESGGDINVDSVVGCEADIMQAGEGCAGVDKAEKNVVQLGAAALAEWGITPSQEVDGGTGVSSIYAGVLETKFTVAMFEEWLGGIDVNDVGKIGLIAQGYNYGSDGWYAFCKNNDVEAWSLYSSLAYQSTIGGVGTANHGQKVMDAYEDAR